MRKCGSEKLSTFPEVTQQYRDLNEGRKLSVSSTVDRVRYKLLPTQLSMASPLQKQDSILHSLLFQPDNCKSIQSSYVYHIPFLFTKYHHLSSEKQ